MNMKCSNQTNYLCWILLYANAFVVYTEGSQMCLASVEAQAFSAAYGYIFSVSCTLLYIMCPLNMILIHNHAMRIRIMFRAHVMQTHMA